MAPHSGRYANEADRGRTPAQWYCLLAGLALLLAGLLGFLADASFDANPPTGPVEGSSFLGLTVNGWHNIVHLASGLVLLAAANTRVSAKVVAIAFGAVYGVVAVIGFVDGDDVLGLIPVNMPDNLFHLALAALGLAAGLLSPARKNPTARGTTAERNLSQRGEGHGGSPERDSAAHSPDGHHSESPADRP